MLGSPTLVAQPRDMLLAAAPVVLVLAISAWLSTRRRTRFSVLHALSVGRSAPPARSLPAGLLRLLRSSVPLALGMRTILAGRGRAFLLTVAITLTGAALVFALSMQASLADRPAGVPSDVPTELPVLVYALDVVLLVITATALLAIALLALRERLRDFGVLKTLGLTPGQVASTLVSPYAVLATVAGVVSVPLGVGLYVALYKVSGGEGDPTIAPWPWLVVIPMTTVLLVVAATTIPARIAMHAPTVGALRTE